MTREALRRTATTFFRVHACTPPTGLLFLHAVALLLCLQHGHFPSRPTYDVASGTWTGGPSVPDFLQYVLVPAALAWCLTLPVFAGTAVFALGLRWRGSLALLATCVLALVVWHSDPTGAVAWLLD